MWMSPNTLNKISKIKIIEYKYVKINMGPSTYYVTSILAILDPPSPLVNLFTT